MIPKEKAIELFEKMYNVEDPMGNYPMCFDNAKQCALIAVDEILNELDLQNHLLRSYWYDVKHELELL
jgi:hypothetical protein